MEIRNWNILFNKKRTWFLRTYSLILILASVFFQSCYQVDLEVVNLPENTPKGSVVFVAGNFNKWDPGDSRYSLVMGSDSIYRVSLPYGFGNLEYKFTRGDWTTVETDECGNFLGNREIRDSKTTIQYDEIACWQDMGPTTCPVVTIVLSKLPTTTAPDDSIFLACNYNGWNPGDLDYQFKTNHVGDTRYMITLHKEQSNLTFKFTRGSWESAEIHPDGSDVDNHWFEFGSFDTIYYEIEEWADRIDKSLVEFTFIIDEIPFYTPDDDDIFLVGDFNGWNPNDVSLIMDKNEDGTYSISIPCNHDYIEYKFTRGGWHTVEGNSLGKDIDNRKFRPSAGDTIFVQIESWIDRRRL